MKHFNKLFVIFLTLALLATAFTGCKGSASSGDEGTKFTVTFDPDGGSAVKAQSVKEGSKANEPAAPTKEGLEFEGWFIGDTEYDFSTEVTANITLKAKWYTAYTVTFDPDGGSAVQSQKVKSGTIAKTPTPPTKEGLEFEGWFIGDTAYDFSTAVTASITLKAKWYKAYTITFNSDGGSPVTAIKVKEGTCATAPAAPTKDGYEFFAWYIDDNTPFVFTTKITSDITLIAKWIVPIYVVTFDADNGKTNTFQSVKLNEKAKRPDKDPAKEGYNFINWYLGDSDTVYDFDTPVTGDITIKAHWLDINATIGMETAVTPDNIIKTILTLQTSRTLKATGAFSHELIRQVTSALKQLYETSPSIMVRLDLSETAGLYSIEEVRINKEEDENNSFCGCKNLETLILPDSVTSIGSGAFYGCTNLKNYCSYLNVTSSNITSTILALQGNVDIRATGTLSSSLIEQIKNALKELYENSPSILVRLDLSETNGLQSLGYRAFVDCKNLAIITIPDSVTSIGYSAFYGCESLTSITIPDGVTSIGEYAFCDCSSLTSINIPDGVTSIGEYAFCDCSSLTSINIPDGVTSIGYCAFYGCESLTSITIPDGVTSIDNCAFEDCSSLTSINIPDGITTICNFTFNGCESLISITIPDSVTSIGACAFFNCSKLQTITFQNTENWKTKNPNTNEITTVDVTNTANIFTLLNDGWELAKNFE